MIKLKKSNSFLRSKFFCLGVFFAAILPLQKLGGDPLLVSYNFQNLIGI